MHQGEKSMNTTVRQGAKTIRKATLPGDPQEIVQDREELSAFPARGSVSIAEAVVEKIAGSASRQVAGIYPAGNSNGFASGFARAVGAGGNRGTEGIRAHIRRNREVSLDMRMAVDYGEHIPTLGREVRFVVAKAIRGMTDLDVRDIRVKITEVRVHAIDDSRGDLPQR
jgi:uncharacterized alkaline shock family protein YloU